MPARLAVIIPVYGHWDYARKAVDSALAHTQHGAEVLLIDDGSPDYYRASGAVHPIAAELVERPGVLFHRSGRNNGLTWAWNRGLRLARERQFEFAVCGNSDLLFTPNWDAAVVAALENNDAHLVGPVTNAPGTELAQDVARYTKNRYQLTDTLAYLAQVANDLRRRFGSRVLPGPINGFCLLARTQTWWAHAYQAPYYVFAPRNDFNSKGQRNPTPLLTLQEYELQRRWQARQLKIGFCPGSFVFHYRSVTRGAQHKKSGWFRAQS